MQNQAKERDAPTRGEDMNTSNLVEQNHANANSLRVERGTMHSTETSDDELREPTDEERTILRKVSGRLPLVAYSLCVVEFAERASYYGAVTIFNNFLQFPLPEGGNGAGAVGNLDQTAGALGKGLQFANAFVLLFKFLSYTVPIFGGWLGDAKIGRYNAVILGVVICGFAHVVMIACASPSVLQSGHGTAPFLISFFLLAIGAGIFKACVLPIILDQYKDQRQLVKTLKSGEKVIVDPEATLQRITLIFYCVTNVGAFFSVCTTYAEKHVGYWLAFLLPGLVYFALPIVMACTYKNTIRSKPNGSELTIIARMVSLALARNKGRVWQIRRDEFWAKVKSSNAPDKSSPYEWTDKLVDDVQRTVTVCVMFLYWPLWIMNNGGIGSIASSQGSSMTTKGAPNDVLININPLSIVLFTLFMSYGLYPFLSKHNIAFGRINRITIGFAMAAVSSAIGAVIQWQVYRTSPCGDHATGCTKGVSPLSIWTQWSVYAIGAMSECFAMVGAYEIAYARSPNNMKALVMAILLFSNAVSAALAQIVTPAMKDPHLVWAWAVPAAALAVQTVIFWFRYRWMNGDEWMTRERQAQQTDTEPRPFDLEEHTMRTGQEEHNARIQHPERGLVLRMQQAEEQRILWTQRMEEQHMMMMQRAAEAPPAQRCLTPVQEEDDGGERISLSLHLSTKARRHSL